MILSSKNHYRSKLNGYRPTHRNKWLFIENGVLSLQELTFLEFCADLMGFDKNNPGYGLFRVNYGEVKTLFRCKSENTIRGWLKKLLITGFVQKTPERNTFSMSCYPRYITPGRWLGESAKYAHLEKDQPVDVILKNFGIDFQTIGEKTQLIGEKKSISATNSTSIALVSSKVDSSIPSERFMIRQGPRTEKEYQDLYEEVILGGGRLTIEDMKWIDENVTETIEVRTDE